MTKQVRVINLVKSEHLYSNQQLIKVVERFNAQQNNLQVILEHKDLDRFLLEVNNNKLELFYVPASEQRVYYSHPDDRERRILKEHQDLTKSSALPNLEPISLDNVDFFLTRFGPMFNYNGLSILRAVRALGIPTSNDHDGIVNCRDKFASIMAIRDLVPVVNSSFTRWDNYKQVKSQHFSYPRITKPNAYTFGGTQILRAFNLHQLIQQTYNLNSYDYTLSQEFIKANDKHNFDLRVMVINGQVKGSFIRVSTQGAIVSNIAQGGYGIAYDIDENLVEQAVAITKRLGLDICGLDFIYNAEFKQWQFLEANASPGYYAFDMVLHKEFANDILDYVVLRITGQHLSYFLENELTDQQLARLTPLTQEEAFNRQIFEINSEKQQRQDQLLQQAKAETRSEITKLLEKTHVNPKIISYIAKILEQEQSSNLSASVSGSASEMSITSATDNSLASKVNSSVINNVTNNIQNTTQQSLSNTSNLAQARTNNSISASSSSNSSLPPINQTITSSLDNGYGNFDDRLLVNADGAFDQSKNTVPLDTEHLETFIFNPVNDIVALDQFNFMHKSNPKAKHQPKLFNDFRGFFGFGGKQQGGVIGKEATTANAFISINPHTNNDSVVPAKPIVQTQVQEQAEDTVQSIAQSSTSTLTQQLANQSLTTSTQTSHSVSDFSNSQAITNHSNQLVLDSNIPTNTSYVNSQNLQQLTSLVKVTQAVQSIQDQSVSVVALDLNLTKQQVTETILGTNNATVNVTSVLSSDNLALNNDTDDLIVDHAIYKELEQIVNQVATEASVTLADTSSPNPSQDITNLEAGTVTSQLSDQVSNHIVSQNNSVTASSATTGSSSTSVNSNLDSNLNSNLNLNSNTDTNLNLDTNTNINTNQLPTSLNSNTNDNVTAPNTVAPNSGTTQVVTNAETTSENLSSAVDTINAIRPSLDTVNTDQVIVKPDYEEAITKKLVQVQQELINSKIAKESIANKPNTKITAVIFNQSKKAEVEIEIEKTPVSQELSNLKQATLEEKLFSANKALVPDKVNTKLKTSIVTNLNQLNLSDTINQNLSEQAIDAFVDNIAKVSPENTTLACTTLVTSSLIDSVSNSNTTVAQNLTVMVDPLETGFISVLANTTQSLSSQLESNGSLALTNQTAISYSTDNATLSISNSSENANSGVLDTIKSLTTNTTIIINTTITSETQDTINLGTNVNSNTDSVNNTKNVNYTDSVNSTDSTNHAKQEEFVKVNTSRSTESLSSSSDHFISSSTANATSFDKTNINNVDYDEQSADYEDDLIEDYEDDFNDDYDDDNLGELEEPKVFVPVVYNLRRIALPVVTASVKLAGSYSLLFSNDNKDNDDLSDQHKNASQSIIANLVHSEQELVTNYLVPASAGLLHREVNEYATNDHSYNNYPPNLTLIRLAKSKHRKGKVLHKSGKASPSATNLESNNTTPETTTAPTSNPFFELFKPNQPKSRFISPQIATDLSKELVDHDFSIEQITSAIAGVDLTNPQSLDEKVINPNYFDAKVPSSLDIILDHGNNPYAKPRMQALAEPKVPAGFEVNPLNHFGMVAVDDDPVALVVETDAQLTSLPFGKRPGQKPKKRF